jgi:hypothetical protein
MKREDVKRVFKNTKYEILQLDSPKNIRASMGFSGNSERDTIVMLKCVKDSIITVLESMEKTLEL